MKVYAFGQESAPAVMLLHGGGLNWWNYRAEAALLEKDFRVLLPVLPGHSGSNGPFVSIEESAAALISYIDESCGGSVLCIGGLSLGAQILTEMLSQRKDICSFALIESALIIPMPLTGALTGPTVSLSYGLIEKQWFAKAQFQALHMAEGFFADYYRDSCAIKKESLIALLKANASYSIKPSLKEARAKTLVVAGGREQGKMRRSAALLQQTVPGSALKLLPGYTHGELSLNRPEEYVLALRTLLS